MSFVIPADLKRGIAILYDGQPHIVETLHVSGTAQTRHKLHCSLRNLKTGRVCEHVFGENERIPLADVIQRRVMFSFDRDGQLVFLDAETFDELVLSSDVLGKRRPLLKENEEYRAVLLEGRLLDVVLPPMVTLRVAETAPASHSGSEATWKTARLDTGLEVRVPLFITVGDFVRIDTESSRYVGKDVSPHLR